MKAIVLACLLLTAQTSFAEKFYRCDVTTTIKKSGLSFSGIWYLSNARSGQISLPYAETNLELTVDYKEVLTGYVNGQYNFILNGTSSAGSFESAKAKGEIKCAAGQEEKVMLMRKGKTLVKQTDKEVYSSLINASTAHNFCFIGKATDVAAELKATVPNVHTAEVLGQGESIVISQNETRCLEGYGSHDDYECVRYDITRSFSYKMPNCYQDYGGDR